MALAWCDLSLNRNVLGWRASFRIVIIACFGPGFEYAENVIVVAFIEGTRKIGLAYGDLGPMSGAVCTVIKPMLTGLPIGAVTRLPAYGCLPPKLDWAAISIPFRTTVARVIQEAYCGLGSNLAILPSFLVLVVLEIWWIPTITHALIGAALAGKAKVSVSDAGPNQNCNTLHHWSDLSLAVNAKCAGLPPAARFMKAAAPVHTALRPKSVP